MKIKILVLISLICLVSPVIAASQTVSFTQTTLWTCPSDVHSVSLKMIGGGAGGMGGYHWLLDAGTGHYSWGNGAGGSAGEYIEENNIPVVPGESYLITIGSPGVGTNGFGMGNGTIKISYGNAGSNSSAFGYIAQGGVASYMSWVFTTGDFIVSLSHGVIGSSGYGNYQIASAGSNGIAGYSSLYTSYGSLPGVGYGAGGGGGGAGSPTGILGGNGGNGAYGYAEITYDSAATQVIPTGYVINAASSVVVSGATVSALQNGVVVDTIASGADGSFALSNGSLIFGVPITIVTTKSGYADDSNIFTALQSGPVDLVIPLIANSYYTNTSIVGITRDNLYGNPVADAIYSTQDISTLVFSNVTTNANGFASVTGLDSAHLYYVRADKTGYSSPEAVLVKPYT